MITVTLKQIRACRPCGLEIGLDKGYQRLVKFLGKDYGDDTPIKFSTIAESNGITDAIWCTRAVFDTHKKEVLLLAAQFAEDVLHIWESKYPDNMRPREAIQATRDYANSLISEDELKAKAAAAADAAAYAAYADIDAAAYAAAYAAAAVAYAYADADADAAADAAVAYAYAYADADARDKIHAKQLEHLTNMFS